MNLMQYIIRQREWQLKAFGPDFDPKALTAHIRKELGEIEADPHDLMEWIDVIILAIEGAWRAGNAPGEICDALATKEIINRTRQWPDWRECVPGKPIEHIREAAQDCRCHPGLCLARAGAQLNGGLRCKRDRDAVSGKRLLELAE